MDLWTVILSALGPTATVGLAIWSDRRARERDRKQQAAKAEEDREQQLE